jgi:hypothetical protein
MRFLKTLTLNRRAIYDDRVALDVENTFTVANSTAMVLPKSDSSLTAVQTEGMIRYNNGTYNAITNPNAGQVEVYQGGNWRALRYKEPNKIILQPAGTGNGVNTVFPLSPQPATVAVNSGAAWDEEQWAKNIIVIVGNVIQKANTNYVVVKGEDITIGPDALGPYTTGTKYLQFTSYVPGIATPEPVIVLHGFDQ